MTFGLLPIASLLPLSPAGVSNPGQGTAMMNASPGVMLEEGMEAGVSGLALTAPSPEASFTALLRDLGIGGALPGQTTPIVSLPKPPVLSAVSPATDSSSTLSAIAAMFAAPLSLPVSSNPLLEKNDGLVATDLIPPSTNTSSILSSVAPATTALASTAALPSAIGQAKATLAAEAAIPIDSTAVVAHTPTNKPASSPTDTVVIGAAGQKKRPAPSTPIELEQSLPTEERAAMVTDQQTTAAIVAAPTPNIDGSRRDDAGAPITPLPLVVANNVEQETVVLPSTLSASFISTDEMPLRAEPLALERRSASASTVALSLAKNNRQSSTLLPREVEKVPAHTVLGEKTPTFALPFSSPETIATPAPVPLPETSAFMREEGSAFSGSHSPPPSPLHAATSAQQTAAPTSNLSTLPLATLPVVEQVAVHLQKVSRDSLEHIRIQLEPASLGAVEISLTIAHDGTVQAVLSAENSDTLKSLQQDKESLERILQGNGLEVSMNSLQFEDRSRQQSGNGAFQAYREAFDEAVSRREALAATLNLGFSTPLPSSAHQASPGRVDVHL
jgi:flagellar hook-length control protein FliK